MSNVAALFGGRAPDGPNFALIGMLRSLVDRAESGELQSFIGTGFTADGMRAAVWADQHDNVYEMLGALGWLQAEYVHRHTANK